MATLQNIRNKSGLLLAVIGIAMLAFILGDLLKSSNSNSGDTVVGEVMGEDILIQKFQSKIDEGISNWKSQNQQSVLTQTTIGQIREQIWNQYLTDLIMISEYDKLGIDVSDDEFFDRVQGSNVHPEVSKAPLFQDPNSQIFDPKRVVQYLKGIIDQDQTEESRVAWLGFQDYLIRLVKAEKYNLLVAKAMFVTNEEVKMDFISNTKNSNFNYVSIPYSSINDTDIVPSESEIKDYYRNHKSEYIQNASKDVDFIVYSVVPSSEDDIQTRVELAELAIEFETYDDYELMARRNSDNINSRFMFSKLDELEDPKWNGLFSSEEGSVVGPYLSSSNVYRIAKLAEIQNRPDSVEARHILIKPNQNQNIDSVNLIINSLKLQIEEGADFRSLAVKYSEDQGSNSDSLGGSLGWFSEGDMVDEFNEACFTSRARDLSIVKSQFGVHLIQVTKKSKSVKKIKVAYIDRNIEPSTETFNSYYSQAATFVGQIINEGMSFDTLVEINNLVKRSDFKVESNKQVISGLPNSREMIRWLNDADVNSVSEVFQFDNSYVVAYVVNEYKEGEIELEDIREEINSLVVKDKKAVKITKEILNLNLDDIAKLRSSKVITNQNAVFGNTNISGIGSEPELVGSIFSNNVGEISPPVIGRNAIYVFEVISVDKVLDNIDLSSQKLQLRSKESSYSNGASLNVLKEAANIKDNRANFF